MNNFLATSQNIHCIGIKGTGISALAGILRKKGKNITGSDASGPAHDAANINPDLDLVIYSSAVPEENIERAAAKKQSIPQLSYPEALGLLTQEYETIAICGTHGKTTTTALTAIALKQALDPTIIVGSNVPELGGKNYRVGKGSHLIIEACEYQRHFLHYSPSIVVITNIEVDHLDYFEDEADYTDAFMSFLIKIRENGTIIANYDDQNTKKVCEAIKKHRSDITIIPFGHKDPEWNSFNLSLPGDHNRYNALAALTVAKRLNEGSEQETIKLLEQFHGTDRRFEQFLGSSETTIISDYAHHPTAIRATLKAVREKFGPDKRVLCVFQPHQYSRTIKLLTKFTKSFTEANELIIPNIYQVRDTEEDIASMSPEKFVQAISKHHPAVHYGHGLKKTVYNIKNRTDEFDIIIVMGAGDVNSIVEELTVSSK